MKLNLRPLLLLAMLLIFSIGMASLLNYFKFESTIKKLQRDRIALIADEVQLAVERGNSLGVELATSTTIQAMLTRQLKSDVLVRRIDIFDDNGKTLFSTDQTRIARAAPSTWIAAAYRMKTDKWSLAEESAFVTGIVLRNSFDLTIGSVAIRYERNGLDRTVSAMGAKIAKIGLSAASSTFILCGLAFGFLSLRMRGDAAKAEQMLDENAPQSTQLMLIEHDIRSLQSAHAMAKSALSGIDQSLRQIQKNAPK